MKRKGMSSEALKIAAAILIAMALFSMLAGFALGPKEADAQAAETGKLILNSTQSASLDILAYE